MSSTDPFGLIGQVLDGQFRVEKFVGEGGFSVVYRGYHVGLDEPIAIKCLKLPIALGSALVESFVKRFRDESRLHYRLSQGNLFIARTLAHGTTMAPATGALVPYMVLEWLEGRSLAADLEVRRAYGDKGRSLEDAIALLDSAVDGLAYAHAQGVVHRDVNPGNLFMTNTSQGPKLKVLDFGVAKVITDHALALGPRAQTIGQIRIFSPQYAAPEQFDDKLGEIGTWTDVYSMALILIEILQDKPAIEGEHLGDYASRSLDPLVRPSPRKLGIAVADETEAILASAVALDPKDRPQDVGQFWGALKAAMRRDVAAGNVPYAEPPRPLDRGPDTASQPSSGNTLPNAMRVQPGRTLNIEKVPIPVRPSEPVSEAAPETPEMPEMPPQTTRMPDAPVREAVVPRPAARSGSGALAAVSPSLPYPQGGFGEPVQFAPQRVTPAPSPIESLARPSLPLESAVPPTPPATEVKVPSPPPPVPNAFEHAPGLRTGENPIFAQGPSTLTGNATPYAIPAKPLQSAPMPSAPIAAAPIAPAQAPVPAGPLPSLMDTHPLPPTMGTALMARPSPSAVPPAAAPAPAYAASQPPPNPVHPFALTELSPDSDNKPTRIGAGALDVFTSLYTSPLEPSAPPPPPPPAFPTPLAPPPNVQSATPTVTTRKRGGGFVVFVIFLVLLVLGAGAYAYYYYYYRVRHGG